MPVLPTLITRLGADGTDAVEPLLAEAHAAVAGLGAELTRFAEGR